MIDITMTATFRPEILRQTLESLRLLKYDGKFRLVANIDPVGDKTCSHSEIHSILAEYYPNHIINESLVGNHIEAIKWVWSHVESEFVLQWEDDWILEHPVNLQVMVDWINSRKTIAQICFDRSDKPVHSYPGYTGRFSYVRDGFWERVKGKSFGGPPALMRRKYLKQVIPHMKFELDTLSKHDHRADIVLSRWEVWLYTGGHMGLVHDIGRQWLKQNNLRGSKSSRGVRWSHNA
jgi:hypothetical protein